MGINSNGYDPKILKLVQHPRPTSMFKVDGREYRVKVISSVDKATISDKHFASKFVALALVGAISLGADSATVNIMNDYTEPSYEPIVYVIPSEVTGFEDIKIISRADGTSDFLLDDGRLVSFYKGVHSEEMLVKASSMGMLYRDDYSLDKTK